MADNFVHRSAAAVWEVVVIEWAWIAFTLNAGFMYYTVDLFCGHTYITYPGIIILFEYVRLLSTFGWLKVVADYYYLDRNLRFNNLNKYDTIINYMIIRYDDIFTYDLNRINLID